MPADANLPYLVWTTAAVMGVIHASDPGHGWLLAALMAAGRGFSRALAYTTILAFGHFVSTLVVVGAVWILGRAIEPAIIYLQLAAGGGLLVFGLKGLAEYVWRGGGEDREAFTDIKDVFKYAFLLGFAHEEEVALAAIVLLGANPLLLSVVYSLSVYAAMLFWTAVSFTALSRVEGLKTAIERISHLLSALILVAIGSYVLYEAVSELAGRGLV